MRIAGKGSITAAVLALSVGAALAASGADAIKERRALMKENGEATKPIVAMLKGAPFDLAAVQKALKTYENAAEKMPALFPADSQTGDTHALPAIWDNEADFDARFKKLGADSAAALDCDQRRGELQGDHFWRPARTAGLPREISREARLTLGALNDRASCARGRDRDHRRSPGCATWVLTAPRGDRRRDGARGVRRPAIPRRERSSSFSPVAIPATMSPGQNDPLRLGGGQS